MLMEQCMQCFYDWQIMWVVLFWSPEITHEHYKWKNMITLNKYWIFSDYGFNFSLKTHFILIDYISLIVGDFLANIFNSCSTPSSVVDFCKQKRLNNFPYGISYFNVALQGGKRTTENMLICFMKFCIELHYLAHRKMRTWISLFTELV